MERVDVDDDDVAALATLDQWKQGGIAHITSIALNFHHMEQERHAGRQSRVAPVDPRVPPGSMHRCYGVAARLGNA
jgi:hypothetical protein